MAHVEQATVGETNAVSVSAEVCDDVLGTIERWFGVDVPRDSGDCAHQAVEGLRVLKVIEADKCTSAIGTPQLRDSLAAQDTAHGLDGEKKGATSVAPAFRVARQSAAGHDRVDVGMKLEFAGPGVQN